MRNPFRVSAFFLFALLLVLSASASAQEEPKPEAPAPQEQQALRTWAIDVHGGSYSLDKLLDAVLEKHPSVKGPTAGVALHIWGESGPERTFRHVVAMVSFLPAERFIGKSVWAVRRMEASTWSPT